MLSPQNVRILAPVMALTDVSPTQPGQSQAQTQPGTYVSTYHALQPTMLKTIEHTLNTLSVFLLFRGFEENFGKRSFQMDTPRKFVVKSPFHFSMRTIIQDFHTPINHISNSTNGTKTETKTKKTN